MRLRSMFGGPRHRVFFRGRVLFAGAVLIGATGVLVGPVSASANSNAKSKVCHSANGIRITDPQVCKGLAFYKGQTMTIYNIASIGGPFDDVDIAVQPYLQAFLGVTPNITSITTGNSVPGQDALASATPNGLSIGVLNVLNDVSLVLTHTLGINFNPARLAYIAATGPSSQPLVAAAGTGYTSFSSVLTASANHTLKALTQTSGTANTLFRTWFGVMGLKPQWVTGYSSLNLEVTGLLRGDGPMALVNLSNSCSLLQGGQVVALAANNIPPVGTNCRKYLLSVPTFKDLERQYAKTAKEKTLWKTMLALDNASGTPFVTQTSVATYKLAALRAAMKWTFAQTNFKTTMFGYGLNPAYTDPVVAKTDYQTSIKLGAQVVCYIEGTC